MVAEAERDAPTIPLYLTTADTCERLGVSSPRLTALVQQGELVPVGLTAGGGRLFRPGDVDRLAERLAARGIGRRAKRGLGAVAAKEVER